MIRRRFGWLAGAVLGIGACGGENPPEPSPPPGDTTRDPGRVERSDPLSVADGFLVAYALRDVPALIDLASDESRDLLKAMKAQGPRGSRHQAFFGGWRDRAVRSRKKLLTRVGYLRNRGRLEARVYFATLANGKLGTLVLVREAETWAFTEFVIMNAIHFEALDPSPD